MADTKTEDLTAAGTITGTELIPIVQGGNSRKMNTGAAGGGNGGLGTILQLKSQKGVASGYASLNSSGKVPASQLNDDVLEYANLAAFPGTGVIGIIYVALDTDLTYIWDDDTSTYIVQSKAATLPSNVGFKTPCRLVATSNVNIATGGVVSIDGINTATGYRVLLTAQSAPAENGIYVAAAGAWTRATDADTVSEIRGALVSVWQGTTHGSSLWFTTFKQGNTLGSTAMNWYRLPHYGNLIAMIDTLLGSSGWQGGGYTTEEAQDAVGAMIDGTLVYVDGTPVLKRAPITGHITIPDGSNAAALGSFTKAELDAAVSDGNVLYSGDVTTFSDEAAQDAVGAMVGTSLVYVDATPLLARAALTGAITSPQDSNATSLGSFTKSQLNTAISDGDALYSGDVVGMPFVLVIAASDETTALTTGTAKVTFRMPAKVTLTDVRASVTTAPTGGTLLTVDVNEGGTTILSTKLTFDASEKTTTTAATSRVISDTSLADDAEMTIDIDAIGSTIAGAGLKVTLIGTYAA